MSRRIALTVVAVMLMVAFSVQAEMTGVVITRDGQAVGGAVVSAFALESSGERQARYLSEKPDRTPLVTGETNKDGVFRLDTDASVVEVMVVHRGFAPATVRMLKNEDVGTVVLTSASTKTGRVRGEGGALAGARVIWRGRGASELVLVTDSEGHYTVPDPAKWGSLVTVIAPGEPIFEEARERGPLSAPPDADVRIGKGVTLSGRVVAADGKTPIAGASIWVDGWPLGMSHEDGTFSVHDVPSRWAEVRAVFGETSASRTRKDNDITIRLEKTPRLSGVVRDAQTRTPLAGVEVIVASRAGSLRRMLSQGPDAQSVISDAKGAFSFELPTGNYQLDARMPGYSFTNVEVSMTAGARADRVLPGARLARLTGTVLDEDRSGVAAAIVSSRPDRGRGFGPRIIMAPSSAWTAPDGRFVLRNLTPGDELRFEAEKRGFPSGETDRIALTGGETRSGVIITIPRGIEVTGLVVDENGVPLSGVEVTSAPARPGARGGMVRMTIGDLTGEDGDAVMSGGDGMFSMRVRQGPTDFSFKLDGYARGTAMGVDVAPGLAPLEVALRPGAVVEGRVVRADGSGVEGVNVSALAEGGLATAVTLPDGAFVLEDLTPGPMMLLVNKEEAFIQQMRRITAPERDIVIELPPGETVSGRVVDKETGEPVTDFQAGIQNSMRGGGMRIMGPSNTRSFRDDAGAFVLENVPVGPLQLLITAAGYVDQNVPGLVLEEGKPVADLVVELDSGTTIKGKVSGPDGRPVQGAIARIQESEGGMGMPRGGGFGNPADAEGNYSMEAVEPGERTIVFTARGYLDETKTVEVSGKEMRLDVTLGKGATVTGSVVNDSGAPVGDAIVSIREGGMFGGSSTRTDANGNFRMEGIEPGRHSFEARKVGLADGSLEDVDVRTGVPVRIVMPLGATISGRVSGVEAADLSRVQVVATADGGDASAMVNSSGNYRIDGAPTGSVRVFARMTGFGGSNSEPKTVEIQSGSQAVVDLEFRTDTIVSGRVTKNRKALDGAMVRFVPKSSSIQTRATANSDSRGDYEVKGLAPGDYDVTVIGMQNLTPYSTETRVEGSTTFDIDMETARVDGRVLDADNGQPVVGAEISLQPKGQSSGFLISREADSDPSGNFILDDVAPGLYTARASKSGYGPHVFDLEVKESGASGVEFKIAGTDGARVRAVDGRDGRTLDASARVSDVQGRTIWEGSLRGGDKGTKLALAPGSYRITIWSSGYAPQVASLSVPSQDVAIGMTPGGKLQIQLDDERARSGRLLGSDGMEYPLSYFSSQGGIRINPGTSTIDAIAPGSYSLVVLREDGSVDTTHPVTVREGQTTRVQL